MAPERCAFDPTPPRVRGGEVAMDTGSGRTTSVWMDAKTPALSPLTKDVSADVCIVGAGIAGVTTAYLLAKSGKSVVVLDDGRVAGGETERTTAHLVTALDDRYFKLERLHGKKGARVAAESHAAAIDLVETIVGEERIDCGFERLDGWLFAPPGEDADVVDKELLAARRAGLVGVEKLARAPIDGFDTGPALRFPRQAQLHPLRYLAAVATAARRAGARFVRAHASEILGGDDAGAKTDAGRRVKSEAVVVATNTPVNDMVEIHNKQTAYRTYVVAMEVPKGAVARALFWDTPDSYHYVRLASPGRAAASSELLIVGGEDHRTGEADDADARFARLVEWARGRFHVGDVAYRWSGQVFEPVDSLALIGRNPGDEPNVYVATGDSGNGMTHGTIAGILLTDLITGRENPWTELYDPSRKTLKAAPQWIKETVRGLPGYGAWLTPGDAKTGAEVKRGCGALVRRGMKKVAVHRDEAGKLHSVSAVCTHLGGIVGWNSLERSWDCPLHGSRFDADGHVVCGPANYDLAPARGSSPAKPKKKPSPKKPRRAAPKRRAASR
jgi:glycine/D-amino acid oxidase-like deaminating enzyme/nitrite reductase/ring-hydroxylating ferredoxin subunit